jgi:ribosomal-protein-serine acetyltransferase
MTSGIQLTDGLVLMRPLQTSDIVPSYEAVRESIAEISPWMVWCHPDYSMEEAANWVNSCLTAWSKGTEYQFAITDAKGGSFLGGCGLNRIDPQHRWANLGYWVRSSQTRRGVATAATLLVARFAFDELKLNRVEIFVAAGNTASLRVAEKVGATREGLLRSKLLVHGKVHDAVMFSLIRGGLESLEEDRSTD